MRLRLTTRVNRQALEHRLDQMAEPMRAWLLSHFDSDHLRDLYREAMAAAIYSTPQGFYERSEGLLDACKIEHNEFGFTIGVDGEEAERINKAAHPGTPEEEIEGYAVRSAMDDTTWARSGHGYFQFLVVLLWQDIMGVLRSLPGVRIHSSRPPTVSSGFNTHHGTDHHDPSDLRRWNHRNPYGHASRPDLEAQRYPQTPTNHLTNAPEWQDQHPRHRPEHNQE